MLRHSSPNVHQLRFEKYTGGVDAPSPPETQQRITPIKHAGMTIRIAVTEPVDSTDHLDKPTIIIKHGFGASRPTYDAYARALAADGNRVMHYGMPRTIRPDIQYHPRYLSDVLTIHSRALAGVTKEALRTNPDGPERVRIIGHSMGGIAVAKFIAHQPETISSAILLGSTGLHPHSFKEMALRGAAAIPGEILPYIKTVARSDMFGMGVHSAWHIGRNPLLLLREGHQAATGDAIQHVAHARRAHVPVGALWMNEDIFFPMTEIFETTKAQFDATSVVDGNHLKPQQYATEAAAETLHLFGTLEAHRQPNLRTITA